MDEEINELKEEEKKEYESVEVEAEERHDRGRSQWAFGAVLILIGLAFLMGNFFNFSFLTNWWAFFILLPAVYNLNRAWSSYRQHGHLTSGARGSLIGGLLIGTVGLIFLFNLDWGVIWPVFIIIIGVGALVGARER
jgi:hypothetical protein